MYERVGFWLAFRISSSCTCKAHCRSLIAISIFAAALLVNSNFLVESLIERAVASSRLASRSVVIARENNSLEDSRIKGIR